MHRRVTLTALLAGLILTSLPAGAVKYEKKVKKSIRSLFTTPFTLQHTAFTIPVKLMGEIEEKVKQKFVSPDLNLWQIKNNNTLSGYAIIDHTYSKTQPFTFLVIFDQSGNILLTRVLRYREEHGGEIKNKKWLKQFIGKNSGSSFTIGQNIDGISSATLSTRAITTAIQKLTLLMDHIIQEEEE